MDGSIIKHDWILGEFSPEFVWDPYRIIHSVYLVTIATPQSGGVFGEITRFQLKMPINQIATKLTVFKITL